ncbi:MAG TPA: PHP domain-containing protein [Candidatus Avipropionibacterium avicola]|uniref:PHP domain-containing protein n=1 Tax=Candidatus Avipropionibacterium avicola TaxID=2840701 RepID=A0A9D1GYC6_9ACTN|nr:PHP domain-containing protein [Candidatus Avipropionibacterium avicola]
MKIDLHTHSVVSDGTDSPEDLIRTAVRAGLDVVALTDHDTGDGLDRAARTADEVGIGFLAGMEMSTAHEGHSVHLLAYGADLDHPDLAGELVRVREGRSGRLRPVLAKLAELGAPVSEAEVQAQVGGSPSVGRPHIADALVAAGHVADRREAFDRFLADGGPAHVPRYATGLFEAVELVARAGGVSVLAHPWGRHTRQVLDLEVFSRLAEAGLAGLEVDHQDHPIELRRELRRIARRLDLLPTGSSDYHGTGKRDHDLGCNTTDPQVYREIVARIG